MAERPRGRSDGGVTMARGESPGKAILWIAAAVALGCVALLVLFGRPPAPEPSTAPPPAEARGAADEPPPRVEAAPSAREPGPEPPPEPSREPAVGSAPADASPGEAPAATVPSGIGLFPPPGTDPIKIGLVVPDDFELPEGFLRHYQVTDDGQELPPILLFHPDYEVLGPDGRPIPLPENHVVPPELAPPGMPTELLVLPPPRDEEGR